MPVRLDHKILLRTQKKLSAISVLLSASVALLSNLCSKPVKYSAADGFQLIVESSTADRFLGDHSERDPPVPIPNTVVKPLSPDGTAQATVWESRKSPGSLKKARSQDRAFLFFAVRKLLSSS